MNVQKQYHLTLFLFFFGLVIMPETNAQSLKVEDRSGNDLSQTEVIKEGAPSEFDIYYEFKVRNVSSSSQVVKAKRIELDVNCSTSYALCWDLCPPATSSCTSVVLENATKRTIEAGAVDETGVGHHYPDGNSGISKYRYVFFLESDSDDSTYVDIVYKHNIVSVKEIQKINVSISPNPAQDNIKVSTLASGKYSIQIIDVLGKTQYYNTLSGQHSIDISTLKKGIYFVKVSDKLGKQSSTQKLIVE